MDLKELERRLEAVRMKPENLPIQLNPNCFIDGFDCDVDPTVVLKVYICTLIKFVSVVILYIVKTVYLGKRGLYIIILFSPRLYSILIVLSMVLSVMSILL